MNNHLNTNSHKEPLTCPSNRDENRLNEISHDGKSLDKKLFALNIPGAIIEVTAAEANELGAFEEDALTEDEALDASELSTQQAPENEE